MRDTYGRNIDYMRVSITDRCNLRCKYCMPEDIELNRMEDILTFEEIEEICQAAAGIGVKKLKVTGGEPLVRRDCAQLIGRLKQIEGIEQVTLTTNGVLLKQNLSALMEAGVDAINVSLDSLDREQYEVVAGKDCLVEVLDGIREALTFGVRVKINSVLLPGYNDASWEELVELTEAHPLDVRFIEMMPIGYGTQYEAVNNDTLLRQMKKLYPQIQPDLRVHGNGPAVYYHIPGFSGSIGFISAVHGRFCGSCNRIRLTAQGTCKPCLCYDDGIDLKQILRGEDRQQDPRMRRKRLREALICAVGRKPAQHCFEAWGSITETKKMVQIGG